VWVYGGLGWEQKEVDGNIENLMKTKGFWWGTDENKRKLMGSWWEQEEFDKNCLRTYENLEMGTWWEQGELDGNSTLTPSKKMKHPLGGMLAPPNCLSSHSLYPKVLFRDKLLGYVLPICRILF
jgi:hypothetical protein